MTLNEVTGSEQDFPVDIRHKGKILGTPRSVTAGVGVPLTCVSSPQSPVALSRDISGPEFAGRFHIGQATLCGPASIRNVVSRTACLTNNGTQRAPVGDVLNNVFLSN